MPSLSLHRTLAPLWMAALLAHPTAAQDAVSPRAFFDSHCVKCHGAEKSKGDITLHDLATDVASDLETWELVLEMLRGGEMPPEEEPQPSESDRALIADWIDAQLRAAVAKESEEAPEPTTRRLTNFEYHNTMRDLLGIELGLADNLPKDPTAPYRFNNSARYLLMGLEQIDRYEENARRAMASAIVDPAPPKIHKTRKVWSAAEQRGMPNPATMQRDELGMFGNRNNTVANGMRVFERPDTGEFRIRVQASAILPPGTESVPLAILMGYDIVGVGVQPGSPAKTVGTLRLTNTVDDPQVFELRGRVENFPWKPRHQYRRGGKITGRLVVTPPHFAITPRNVYDDGTLNDNPDPLTKPRIVVDWIEFESPIGGEAWPPAHHTAILFDSPLRESDPNAYVRAVLKRFLPRAFRRPVIQAEIDRFAKVYDIVSDRFETLEAAMRETLAMALISPDFLYHAEGDDQHALASRLSYFLWGSMPDATLFALAAKGQLDDPEVLAAQVERLLADERSHDFVDNFATQWLSLGRMRTVPINLKRFPRFLYTIKRGERSGREHPNRPTIRDHMHAETVAYVAELIRRNASVLELVDSEFAMLNQPLAAHYGVEGIEGQELRAVDVSAHPELGGVLTHGSILIGTSTGTAPHAVYRAVWLREAILGDEVPAPPANVPALEDSVGEEVATEATTLKDLLRLHRQETSCNDCHARLDPWGIPFELYDTTGRFAKRVPPAGTTVAGFDARQHENLAAYRAYIDGLATEPIDAAAKLPNGPEVDGIEGLKQYLLSERRQDIAENVVRRLMTYALGRELTTRDRYVVEQLVRDAEPNGYRFKDLIVGVCRTDLFARTTKEGN